MFQAQRDGAQVDGDEFVEGRGGQIVDGLGRAADAGVVERTVETAVAADRLADCPGDLFLGADVARRGHCLAAGAADGCDQPVKPVRTTGGGGYCRALAREPGGRGRPDAAGGPKDDHDLALEPASFVGDRRRIEVGMMAYVGHAAAPGLVIHWPAAYLVDTVNLTAGVDDVNRGRGPGVVRVDPPHAPSPPRGPARRVLRRLRRGNPAVAPSPSRHARPVPVPA